jgi:site-specific recombinase XerD
LKDAGYAPWHLREVPDAIDLEVDRFDQYLLTTAGLQEATREYRRRYAREFLKEFFGHRNGIDVARLVPRDIVRYLSKRASGLRPASAKVLATSLRSYLRFLRLKGDCVEALIRAVPAPANWRLASLPSVLTDEEVQRLLAAFDRKTESGLRDYAITRCLLDLALRAQEVARLRLDDLDWRNGKLRIVGSKSRRDDELPLTAAVGGAIAAYIRRGRPETAVRQVFVPLRPPAGQGITSRTVCGVIVRAAVRAGLDATVHGPRTLRHTAASRMVRHGARIKDVADVLRHRSLDTTAIYTKVDLPHLAAVAMPWPQRGEL